MFNKTALTPQQQKLIVYITLAIITFAGYWQVHQFGFINFDDNVYVSENFVIFAVANAIVSLIALIYYILSP